MRTKTQKNKPVCVCSSHLNIDNGDGGLGLVEVPSHPVHSLGDKVQHQIQINLIFLEKGEKERRSLVQGRKISTTKDSVLPM